MLRYNGKTLTLEITLIVLAAMFFLPVILLVNLSLKSPSDTGGAFSPPQEVTLGNYASAWSAAGLGSALLNSAVVMIASVIIIVLISALASYWFARATSQLSTSLFLIVMLGLLLPIQLGLVPIYQMMRDLELLGSVWSLVIYYAGLQVPFSVFLYTGFLRNVDVDYEEAATIDGCSPLKTFWHVVFPMLKPITGTIVVLNAINIWNDFMTPLLFLSGSPSETVPVALFSFVGQYVADWGLVFAGLVISIAPILLIYLVMQKRVIEGFTGGLKG